jgi:hypothetical protein
LQKNTINVKKSLEPINDLGAMNVLAIFSYFFVKKPRFRTTKPTFFASNYEKIAQKFISLEIVNRFLEISLAYELKKFWIFFIRSKISGKVSL